MENELLRESLSDLALGRLSPESSLQLLEEIEHDPERSKMLECCVQLVGLAAQEGGNAFRTADQVRTKRTLRIFVAPDGAIAITRRRATRQLAMAVSVVGILLGSLVLVSQLSKNKYHELAAIEESSYDSAVRSGEEDDLSTALNLHAAGRDAESIRLLERFIRAYPRSDLLGYVHYRAGAVYLCTAERSFFSLFPTYDRTSVLSGLAHLDASIALATNPRLIEEARWLRAKGLLMVEKRAEALEELESVRNSRGFRSFQARELEERMQGEK